MCRGTRLYSAPRCVITDHRSIFWRLVDLLLRSISKKAFIKKKKISQKALLSEFSTRINVDNNIIINRGYTIYKFGYVFKLWILLSTFKWCETVNQSMLFNKFTISCTKCDICQTCLFAF